MSYSCSGGSRGWGGGGGNSVRAPLKFDQLCVVFSIHFFLVRMLKKAQIARESIKTTLKLPGLWTPAKSVFGSELVMCVRGLCARGHIIFCSPPPPPPPPPMKILDPPLYSSLHLFVLLVFSPWYNRVIYMVSVSQLWWFSTVIISEQQNMLTLANPHLMHVVL